jgi:hypothetical protein
MWQWLRKVFGSGEGATQVGKGDRATRGSSSGHDSPVITASGNVHLTIRSGDLGRQQELDISALDEFAKKLLLAAAASEHSVIQRYGHDAGVVIHINGTPFSTDGDPRAGARLESALQELVWWRLIQARGSKMEIFCLTPDGYRVADILRTEKGVGP